MADKVKFLGHQSYNLAVIPCILQSLKYQVNIDLDCVDDSGRPYKIHEEPKEYTLLLFATEAIMAAASALLPIQGLMTGFWIMHLLML